MIKNNICVLGGGRWGLNHIKTLFSMKINNVGCVDNDHLQLKKIKSLFPKTNCFKSLKDSLDSNFDGYIIATPPFTHADLACKIIALNKPILVEKPLCLSIAELNKIKFYIEKYNGKLLVGHLLLFHPAIQKIKKIIDSGMIGKIQYMYSNRLNVGIVRKEENVLWSFAPHDVSIFQFLSKSFPEQVHSNGISFLQKNIHDVVMTSLKYKNGIKGHIFSSWVHPFKEHRLIVIGTKGAICFEDSSKEKEIIFYDKKIKINNKSIILENLPFKKIKYKSSSPLENELQYFLRYIKGEKNNLAGIKEGGDVIQILEMANKTLR